MLCLQEHFLTASSVSLLKLTDCIQLFAVPAISSERGTQSGEVAILDIFHLATQLAGEDEHYIAVKTGDTDVFSVYLPTDYRDLASKEGFTAACAKLVHSVRECLDKHFQVIVVGDFNRDLNDSANAKTARVKSFYPLLLICNLS